MLRSFLGFLKSRNAMLIEGIDLMEFFNKRLQKLRKERGLSVRTMAKKLKVPESTYREWEYGRAIRGEPYVKIAEVLEVSLQELFGQVPSNKNILLDEILNLEILVTRIKMIAQKQPN